MFTISLDYRKGKCIRDFFIFRSSTLNVLHMKLFLMGLGYNGVQGYIWVTIIGLIIRNEKGSDTEQAMNVKMTKEKEGRKFQGHIM